MPLDQVIARATVNASRTFEVFRDRGTLNVGAPADVALLELRDGTFEFLDNFGNKRTGASGCFRAGRCSRASASSRAHDGAHAGGQCLYSTPKDAAGNGWRLMIPTRASRQCSCSA